MVEYKDIFLDEMSALFLYFVEFSEDGSILPKDYLEDCAISGADKRPIIIIIYNESTFLANNGHQKL